MLEYFFDPMYTSPCHFFFSPFWLLTKARKEEKKSLHFQLLLFLFGFLTSIIWGATCINQFSKRLAGWGKLFLVVTLLLHYLNHWPPAHRQQLMPQIKHQTPKQGITCINSSRHSKDFHRATWRIEHIIKICFSWCIIVWNPSDLFGCSSHNSCRSKSFR